MIRKKILIIIKKIKRVPVMKKKKRKKRTKIEKKINRYIFY